MNTEEEAVPELRLNMLTRKWVIIAREKSKKAEDFIRASTKKRHPAFLETCAFCPGNEEKSPGERYRIHGEKGWSVRVILNKFSVLSTDGDRHRSVSGLKQSITGFGTHEIVVESPLHHHTTALMPVEQIENVLRAYKDRLIECYKDPRVEHVVVFKNSGHDSGTTIEHSLSQIVGMPVTPFEVRSRNDIALRFFDNTGECLQCRMLAEELAEDARIVHASEHFAVLVPYAALSPFHLWIFPRRHSGTFADIRPEEAKDLAAALKTTLAKIYWGLENPDFNYVLRTAQPSAVDSPYLHWYLSIVPRVSTLTGFELGSGMFINPLVPEESATFLKRVKITEYGA
ncbi:MAG: DUF4931 domain-containing protein [Nitrospirota bacterium]